MTPGVSVFLCRERNLRRLSVITQDSKGKEKCLFLLSPDVCTWTVLARYQKYKRTEVCSILLLSVFCHFYFFFRFCLSAFLFLFAFWFLFPFSFTTAPSLKCNAVQLSLANEHCHSFFIFRLSFAYYFCLRELMSSCCSPGDNVNQFALPSLFCFLFLFCCLFALKGKRRSVCGLRPRKRTLAFTTAKSKE